MPSKYRIVVFHLHPAIAITRLVLISICIYAFFYCMMFLAKTKEPFYQNIHQFTNVLVWITMMIYVFFFIKKRLSYLIFYLDKTLLADSNILGQQQQVKNYKIWWNYIYGQRYGSQMSGTQYVKSNRISLWLEINLTNGKSLLINQRLTPWKGIPENIPYSIERQEYSNNKKRSATYLKTFNSLEKLHNNVLLTYAS